MRVPGLRPCCVRLHCVKHTCYSARMQDAPRDANLSLRIETDLLERLKSRAAKDDRTMAQTVRRALRQYVDADEAKAKRKLAA